MAIIREDIPIKSTPTKTNTTTPTISVGDSGFSDKNKGGLIGGIGYLGEKVASGAVQSIEGISDYAIGGIAKLFGFDKFAERQFRNDWFGDWYTSAGDWFNAGKGWSVAGDVAGGIGTSLPAIAAALGITLATGGAGAGAGAAILAKGAGAAASFLTAGLGAAGNATKEAYRETGNLGSKEFAYGALTGTLEGGLEAVTNLIGVGGGAAINSILKSTKKGAMLAAMRNGIGATMAKGFFGEAFEEGVAEIFSAPFKRATYDKDAENASANQVLYASLIGGLSGMVMGSASVYSAARNMGRGNKIVESGETNQVLDFAKQLTERADAEKLGDIRQFKQVSETYKTLAESLKNTNGEIKTAAQRRMLGELKIDNVSAFYAPKMFNEATRVVSNAEAIAEMYATVDENGNKITYTKEQLLEGVDLDNLRKTLPTALETNEALRNVVFSSMAGEMLMDASAFQEAILSGTKFAGDADLEAFLASNPTKEQIEEVETALGIDDLYTVDARTFNEKAQAYKDGLEYDAKYDEFYQNTRDRQAFGTPLSSVLSTDGATTEATTEANTETTTSETNTEAKDIRGVSLLEAMDFAKKNIKDYQNLDSESQARVRRLIRQAKANGFTEAETRAYAKVSARSGIDIVIGKEGLKRSNGTYADGKYSPDENRIYVNPEGSRSPAKLLFHELTHALYTDKESRKWLDNAAKNLSEEDKRIIKALYFQDANLDETKLDEDDAALYKDEISSRYIEGMLNDDALLEKLCGEHPTLKDKILNFFKGAESDYADTPTLSREAKKLYKHYKTLFDSFAEKNQYGVRVYESAEEARMSGKVDDSRFSLQYAPEIADGQREYVETHKVTITEDELDMAINQTAELVELMSKFKDILPKDTRGKTLVKNGSYDISVENTTICIRTLSYNSFTDKVSEKIGRPLTQMESFLVSQKLYEIAKEPQCLYCYVSLDRKAYNEMLLRYIRERDSAVEKYKEAGMPDTSTISVDKVNSAKEKGTTDKLDEASKLFLDFLEGRKVTKNMLDRYKSWMSIAKQGGKFLSTKAVATEAQRKALIEGKESPLKEQAKDMFKYAQSASWAKKQTDYVAYYNDILKLSDAVVKNLNSHYGLRWYSFSDYSAAFIVENMQQITDAAIRGLKGLAYTKDTDFVKIFAPTGMNINISVYAAKDADGNYYIDEKQSANLKEAIALRDQYENVGIVVVATDNAGVEWALSQNWSDVVIPFHTVRTGADVAAFYDWTVFNNEQSDTIGDENLWNAYVDSIAKGDEKKRKKVAKMVYPSEHQNNRDTYLKLCRERGLTPRFSSFLANENYMKLVNETRQSESATKPLKAKFDVGEAKKSFTKFKDKGGYFEGWYNDGIDVDGEAEIVANDIKKGLKPDEVEYSVKGFDAKKAMEKRKTNRSHDRMAISDSDLDNVGKEGYNESDSTIKETVTNEERRETRSDFIRRKNKGVFQTIERGESAHSYRPISPDDFSKRAKETYRELQKLGIKVIVCEDLETNKNGITRKQNAEASTLVGELVFVKNSIATPPIETAGHEAFHYWMENANRENYVDVLVDNILFSSKEFLDFQSEISQLYFGDESEIYGQKWGLLLEENYAYISGMIHSGDTENVVHKFLRNYDEVKNAWDKLVSEVTDKTHRNDRYAISDDEIANYKNVFGESGNEVKMNAADEEVNELDMSESVGKEKKQYKLTFKEKFFTVKDGLYIETVDEMYGIAKYLKKVGKISAGKVDAIIQAVRASRGSAQTMIGNVQYDVFSEDGKELGEGLTKIVKPIKVKGEKIYNSFNEYLMHWLNIDRMSLRDKSLAELSALQSELEASVDEVREINQLIAESQDNAETVAELKKKKNKLLKEIKQKKKQIDEFEVMENKPVFGKNETRAEALTAEQSRQRIAELEKAHPDFKAVAEKVWKYSKNLNHMRVEAGLISTESEEYMNYLYPHYVPAYRDVSRIGASAIKGKGNLEISSTVKSAKGGGQNILDAVTSLATQTQELMRAGRINMLFAELYNVAKSKGGSEYVEIVGEQTVSKQEGAEMQTDSIELKPKFNQITGFIDGKKVTLAVSSEIFVGFESIGKPTVDPNNKIAVVAQKANELYKRLLTSFSPAFFLRNPIRDLQDAGLNSKHAMLFAKNLGKSAKLMFNNSKEWQMYRAYGGYASSIFNSEGGFTSDLDKRGFAEFVKLIDADATTAKNVYNVLKNGGKNILTGIENANAFVEQVTRFTEFLASLEAGDSVSVAINNSAEVSTNFGRRGRTTKVFNATIMPFLNPSIQGFDKMIRNVTDAVKSENVAKALGSLFGKAALIGIAPMVINMLMYGGDDDYEELRETDKENNYLIKIGEGKFIKIPRGRVASVIGGAANRTAKLAKGENADLAGYAKNVVDQVTPVQNLTRTIFSPFFDAKNNRTWYGTEIEGREWDNTTPKDRYDESTSSIAVGIGKVTGWSPKKIHYVLDQYSGVIGDFVLPATTSKAERDFFSGNFVLDAATSNKLSSEFYKLYDKAQYAKTAGDEVAVYQVKYLNAAKKAIGEMFDEKQKIQQDSTLTNVEKLQKSRVVQILINEAYKSAMADYEAYTQVIAATEGIENTEAFKNMYDGNITEENIQKIRYTEATHLMYGAERALREYNSDVYAKSQILNSAGIDYEVIYKDYFSTKGITSDTDKQGKAISGSKRKKVVASINAMNISREQKLLLIASKGYALQDGDIRGLSGDSAKKQLLNYILKLNISKEEKIKLAEMCGFEVKNGKIIMKK